MKAFFTTTLLLSGLLHGQAQMADPDIIEDKKAGKITIQPVQHASLILKTNSLTIYADPFGASNFQDKGLAAPDVILITDIHGDHFDQKTIDAIKQLTTIVVAPPVVAEKLTGFDKDHLIILRNGDKTTLSDVSIEAIPMYNLPESEKAMHTKGRGNGYVVTIGSKRFYLSGDTQGIPEMRALKDIDVAFVCMNLPYTMDVKEAADAVLAFQPRIVYPYHYRGQQGLSDVNEFKTLVDAGNKKIEVRLRNWYPGK